MKQLFTAQVTVHHHKRVPITRPGCAGYTTEALRDTIETVTIYADLEAIAKRLGPRAAASVSGKSKEISGLLVVKHHRGK